MPRENPFAPPSLNGINDQSPDGYLDMDYSYVFNVTLLGAQSLPDQWLPISPDAEFRWRALVLTAATGQFSVRFLSQAGYYLSSDFILSTNLSTSPTDPFPIVPEMPFDAGSKIGIDFLELTGQTNFIQLLFRGVKRFAIR